MRWPFKEMIRRDPDEAAPYLTRWMLLPHNQVFNVYLHKFTQPDWADDLHDHPFKSIGIGLKGGYLEEVQHWPPSPESTNEFYYRGPFCVTYRSEDQAHAIRKLHNDEPVWTLFIRGPSYDKAWGFWRGGRSWVPAEQYLAEKYYNKETA